MNKFEILAQTKVPVSTDKHLGIEIEFVSPFEHETLITFLVDLDLQNNCNLTDDGSIDEYLPSNPRPRHICDDDDYDWELDDCGACYDDHLSDSYGHELRVITTEKDLKYVMDKVSAFLKRAKAEVNDTCGLHVHLDCRHRSAKVVINRLLKKQKEMHKLVNPKRLQNDYCKPITKDEIKRFWKKEFDARYRDINITSLQRFNTIEVRLHQGSVKAKEIVDWCKYLISIVDNKKGVKNYVKSKIKNTEKLLSF